MARAKYQALVILYHIESGNKKCMFKSPLAANRVVELKRRENNMKRNNTGNEHGYWYKGKKMKFDKSLYSRVSLIKAAYNFTDVAYVHLDSDDKYYYVSMEPKKECEKVTENEFINEMLTQTVRHEIYQQTKSIRELMLARSLATSVIMRDDVVPEIEIADQELDEDSILKDWYAEND